MQLAAGHLKYYNRSLILYLQNSLEEKQLINAITSNAE